MKVKYNLDILKPHQPSVDLLARSLMKLEGVSKVEVKVDELDQKTASLHINIEGVDLSLESINEVLNEMNCALHSVDEVLLETQIHASGR